jgi:hypothetical protein
VMEIVFDVDAPVQPPGNAHEYDEAPDTRATLYVVVEPAQITDEPEILVGCVGIKLPLTNFCIKIS